MTDVAAPIAPSPRLASAIAEGMADGMTDLDIAGQVAVALKLLLTVTKRLPLHLQAETVDELLIALAAELPRGMP